MKSGRNLGLIGAAILVSIIFTGTSSATLIRDLTFTDDAAVQSGVPAGSIFGTVKVSAQNGFLGFKTVKFTVDVNDSVLTPDANFGIQKFGFDFDPSVTGIIIIPDLPAGWTVVVDKGLGGLGKFEIVGVGTVATRTDPLTFTVITTNPFASKSALENAFFEENKLGYHFAVHIAGFKSIGGSTSAFFTDGVPIPELATLFLFTTGIAGMVALRKSQSKARLA